jgi:WD40 repeat protein
MDFTDRWRDQIKETLAQSARLAAQEANLEHALLATGLLWPLREPVREFDMEAIQAVNGLLGSQAKLVLRVVQGWDDDLLAAARQMSQQLAGNTELDAALNELIKQFQAFPIFSKELDKQSRPGDQPVISHRIAEVETLSSTQKATILAGRPRVFVSYARSDGEALAQDIRQRLEQEGIPVWQDRTSMEGGRDWWLQITDALNQVEFMVLVATPAALRSEVVRKEWRYARQQGVCVYPVQGSNDLNFNELPRWMRAVHFYNPTLEWPKLVTDLNDPCETPRVPFMAEELPDDFVPRSGQLSRLTSLLLDEHGDPIAATVALSGAGGYGKTMLATALCHHDDIRYTFDDGVLWITLGEAPGDLTGRVIDLIEVLSGERPGFAGLDAAESRLAQLLADRDILMVIDDVWNIAHLKPFLAGGSRCARVITTRNIAALPPKTQSIEVEAMGRAESVALLGAGLEVKDTRPLEQLAGRLSDWPLLLKLANSALRDRIHNNNQPLNAALSYVNRALEKRGLTAFDAHNAAARNQAVSQTLGVSQELLSDNERARYTELAIFPGEVNIPLTIVQKLWGATANLDDFDTEELCNRLHQLSLVAHFEPNQHYITLQNIVRNYLAQEQHNKLAGLHQKFLDAVAVNLPLLHANFPRWASLAHNESYLWTYLAYHLAGGERGAELVETVKDLSYLVAKTHLRTAYAAEADLLAARHLAPHDITLTRLHQAFSQSSHLFNQCETERQIANTLHSRLAHVRALDHLVQKSMADLPKPLITAHLRLPDLPDASLIRALGHRTPVLACAISADGSKVVSMARDIAVRIWDARTGAELHTLTGHVVIGNSCAISDNGAVVVSTTWDGVLKIWEAESGAERFSIDNAHDGSIFACAINPDGTLVVTAGKDKTLKVWDALTGTERLTLTGHDRSATGCAISGDSATIVSSSSDGTVKIWNTQTGQLRQTIRVSEDIEIQNPVANLTFTAAASALLSCAISRDGSTIVSTLPDATLKVWNALTGKERLTLRGHTGWIENCAINADGSLIVSVGNDKTIRGWDGRTGEQKFVLEGHLRTIAGCALSADGAILATASQDKSVKVWDVGSIAEESSKTGHTLAAQCCAVSANGTVAALDTSGNALKLLDPSTGLPLRELKGHARPITSCAISSDGAIIVTASQDRTLKIWDAASGRERATLQGHSWAVNGCALSQDGSLIVSGSEDSTLKVWDARTGSERLTLAGHMRAVNSCAISSNNQLIVSASADKMVKIWDAQSGKARFTLIGHDGPVNSCAISPDSTLVASAANDETIKVWETQTGQECFTLKGHASPVLQCAFSPNGQHLLSVAKNNTLFIWDIQTEQLLTTLLIDGSLAGCAWFSDGQLVLAVGARGAYFLRVVS